MCALKAEKKEQENKNEKLAIDMEKKSTRNLTNLKKASGQEYKRKAKVQKTKEFTNVNM